MEEEYKVGNLEVRDSNLEILTINSSIQKMIDLRNTYTQIAKSFSNNIIDLSSTINSIITPSLTNFANSMANMCKAIGRTISTLEEITNGIRNVFLNIPKIDLNPIISYFKTIEFINLNIAEHSSQEEIANDITNATIEIIENKDITQRQKRNIFKNFFQILRKTVLFFFLYLLIPTLFAIEFDDFKAKLEAKYEIAQLEKTQENEEAKLNYRYITKETRLYKNRKLKTKIDVLAVGEIVIVLDEDKERLKVQILDTNEIGWILKKYSKKL